ncbi:hypothetical protein H6504_00070 [Candidatus Woesearchaeota archaeon]|nr:hypothetical protein [Candidatus Woesearchaeota archaeon]
MAKDLENLTAFGPTEEAALEALAKQKMPFEEGHKAYDVFAKTVIPHGDQYLAILNYSLKPGFTQAPKTGTGAYQPPKHYGDKDF